MLPLCIRAPVDHWTTTIEFVQYHQNNRPTNLPHLQLFAIDRRPTSHTLPILYRTGYTAGYIVRVGSLAHRKALQPTLGWQPPLLPRHHTRNAAGVSSRLKPFILCPSGGSVIFPFSRIIGSLRVACLDVVEEGRSRPLTRVKLNAFHLPLAVVPVTVIIFYNSIQIPKLGNRC